MRDGSLRRLVKATVRAIWWVELTARRRLRPPRFRLAGTCEGCGACCERPTIAVGRAIWFLPVTRRIFVAWQQYINGFVLVERIRDGRALAFRCTHYDPETLLCDSYDSRPALCRDYPRLLLHQPWPELFEACTYRVVDRHGAGLSEAIDALELAPGEAVRLKERLRLDDGPPTDSS